MNRSSQIFQKIIGIDAFRGLAAMLVFIFHYYTFYKESLPAWTSIFSSFHIGVDLFFVLSGFLITLSLWRSSSFSSYIKKRLRRIAPFAIATTLVFWGIIQIKKPNISIESVTDLFTHLFLINGFFPQWYHSINPVSWSISIEMAFYLFLPLLWITFAQKNITRFLYIFFGCVLLSFMYRAGLFFIFEDWTSSEKIIFSEQLWGRLDQFFLGTLLAYIFSFWISQKNEDSQEKNRTIQSSIKKNIHSPVFVYSLFSLSLLLISVSLGVFTVFQSGFRDFFAGQVFLHFITASGFFFLLLWFLLINDTYKKNSIMKLLSWLGELSYGIYLLHFAVISQVFARIENPAYGFIISVFITLVLSFCSWHYFEKWFLQKK